MPRPWSTTPRLSPDEVKALVAGHKWMSALSAAVHGELARVSQALTGRVKEPAQRYRQTMPELAQQVEPRRQAHEGR